MDDIIQMFKALSDEVRLRIVLLLLEGELCVCELEKALHMSQPRISQHLFKLKVAGLVVDRKLGKWKHYSLSEQGKKYLEMSILKIFNVLKKNRIIKSDQRELKKIKSCCKIKK